MWTVLLRLLQDEDVVVRDCSAKSLAVFSSILDQNIDGRFTILFWNVVTDLFLEF